MGRAVTYVIRREFRNRSFRMRTLRLTVLAICDISVKPEAL